ncbi:MAG TPA: 2-phospho-L-lactate transferase CofD family protein, partial [Actinomycetota bacterium]|nr:2-phospho-L-lactate transferase CofD family protein [Actinomycetota bacterium]
MRVVALAGGIGAGKFLRGLLRVIPPRDVTVVVNTADDIELHGLHVSPDLDSVVYWLGGAMDRERGWGRRDETFRATEELGRFGAEGSWFGLGDLDLATHLFRTGLLRAGATLSEVTARVAARFGLACRVLPMSDDPVTTRIEAVSMGRTLDLHFQEYWV